MIIGKSLYEGNLLNCQFSRFFLNQIVEKSNQFDDLKNLDPEIYKNLMELKDYEGNVEDFDLYFTIDEQY